MEFFAAGHEHIACTQDHETGLRTIIALHSTALGPGLGGTRFFPYPDERAALADVLRLSKAMTYKNACAGLAAGGGKAVILGDPATTKTPALLAAYGRAVAALQGRYITACDVGTYVADMDVISESNPWTTGRSRERGGAGDSGELTALGVFEGLRAAAQHRWGEPTLAGKRIGITGLGKVGLRLAQHLADDGAAVIAGDVSEAAVRRALELVPGITIAAPDEVPLADVDAWSPNALGGAVTEAIASALQAEVICGGANNQLATPELAHTLTARDILWCPDYVVNAGGVIAVGDEGLTPPYNHERATSRVHGIFATTLEILASATELGLTTAAAADALAERRLAHASTPYASGER